MLKRDKKKYMEVAQQLKVEQEDERARIEQDEYVIIHPSAIISKAGNYLDMAVTKARDWLATGSNLNVLYVVRLEAVITKRTEIKTDVALVPHEEDEDYEKD